LTEEEKPEVSVIITDFDDTLYDWVGMWARSFTAMLSELAHETGIPRETLEKDFRQVFQKHGTTEYAFAIQELQVLQEKFPGQDLASKFSGAIHAYNKARKESLRLYPTVKETLRALKERGCLLIGYTESMAFYTNYRIRTLGLDDIFDYIYSPRDHGLPHDVSRQKIRRYPPEHYQLKHAIHRHTPEGIHKPSKRVLLGIIRDIGADPNEVVYVGDKLGKDVSMAKMSGVTDVYAKYGAPLDRQDYELLRSVTHWSQEDVEREKQPNESEISPSYVLDKNFKQLLKLFRFKRFVRPIKRVNESERRAIVEIWKKTIDVQQHFNDLELRIRNYAITLMVAILGAIALIENQRIRIVLFGLVLPLSAVLIVGGLVAWGAFYFMDRFWYHRLLHGAVEHGKYIEVLAREVLPELRLTHAIAEASPFKIPLCSMQIHSIRKIDIFYAFLFLCLGILALALFQMN